MKITDILATMDYGPAPESATTAHEWLARHKQRFGHFIGGRWLAGARHFDSINPANGELLAKISQGTVAVVEQAVQAAEKAFKPWQALGGHGRARHLYALARSLQKHARLLAVLETLDNGKPIRETSI